MNSNMTGFKWFQKSLRSYALAKEAFALEGLRLNCDLANGRMLLVPETGVPGNALN